MGDCKHRHKKFIGVSDYRGYPEKVYSCQDCGMLITDFASDSELRDYQKNTLKADQIASAKPVADIAEDRVS